MYKRAECSAISDMISDRGYDNSGSFYGVHVHGRPWMSEQSFISEHCFRKATKHKQTNP